MTSSGRALPDWLNWLGHPTVLVWIGAISLGLVLASLIGLPFLLTRIPPDYFKGKEAKFPSAGTRGWYWRVAKNLLGVVLLVAGIAMLLLPGQGILTLLGALLCLDFPKKRKFERWFMQRRGVLRTVNALRARAGRAPIDLEPNPRPKARESTHD
jgi:MFS family permease